ncbi:MAG: tRNA (N(6)-L-threonylcarbamoyladenosine(37)-C(2))-methylthiotransferase MtaB [Alphaproteobacteria bacterium]|nr:tRNA (N(6)-L-threonylcarbamoyladenosine(37)-C(2))-methylthiotransferase MtaB [Alphaproteobacteria bacterium]
MKIITFGCRMNAFESAVIARLIQGTHKDMVILNTCAVTAEAERQCRQAIRKARRDYPEAEIVVTGCAAQLHPEVFETMPEVDRVIGNLEKLSKDTLRHSDKCVVGEIDRDISIPLVMDFEGKSKAFLQIQQGCDHACTFCIVRFARGHNKGIPESQLIEQAKVFVQNGYKELVLTGADVASYPGGLVPLLDRLLQAVPDIQRLRLGSLDPGALDDDFIQLVKKYSQIMPYFHLSIQSGDNMILKRMGRRHTYESVMNWIQKMRQICPLATFGADFITGFPTESEEQFNSTLQLVKTANITHLHVFPYSERPGTPAVQMPQVPIKIRKERAAKLRKLGQELYEKLLKSMVGKVVPVLTEGNGSGMTDNYVRVILPSDCVEGEIVDIKIKGVQNDALVG